MDEHHIDISAHRAFPEHRKLTADPVRALAVIASVGFHRTRRLPAKPSGIEGPRYIPGSLESPVEIRGDLVLADHKE